MLNCIELDCLRLASARSLPVGVVGPVDRPPCRRQAHDRELRNRAGDLARPIVRYMLRPQGLGHDERSGPSLARARSPWMFG